MSKHPPLLHFYPLRWTLCVPLKLSAPAQDVLEKATTTTFRELGAYAKAQHVIGVKAAFGRRRLVPTALAVAGSMNSADHAGTFSALVAYLQEQVTPVGKWL